MLNRRGEVGPHSVVEGIVFALRGHVNGTASALRIESAVPPEAFAAPRAQQQPPHSRSAVGVVDLHCVDSSGGGPIVLTSEPPTFHALGGTSGPVHAMHHDAMPFLRVLGMRVPNGLSSLASPDGDAAAELASKLSGISTIETPGGVVHSLGMFLDIASGHSTHLSHTFLERGPSTKAWHWHRASNCSIRMKPPGEQQWLPPARVVPAVVSTEHGPRVVTNSSATEGLLGDMGWAWDAGSTVCGSEPVGHLRDLPLCSSVRGEISHFLASDRPSSSTSRFQDTDLNVTHPRIREAIRRDEEAQRRVMSLLDVHSSIGSATRAVSRLLVDPLASSVSGEATMSLLGLSSSAAGESSAMGFHWDPAAASLVETGALLDVRARVLERERPSSLQEAVGLAQSVAGLEGAETTSPEGGRFRSMEGMSASERASTCARVGGGTPPCGPAGAVAGAIPKIPDPLELVMSLLKMIMAIIMPILEGILMPVLSPILDVVLSMLQEFILPLLTGGGDTFISQLMSIGMAIAQMVLAKLQAALQKAVGSALKAMSAALKGMAASLKGIAPPAMPALPGTPPLPAVPAVPNPETKPPAEPSPEALPDKAPPPPPAPVERKGSPSPSPAESPSPSGTALPTPLSSIPPSSSPTPRSEQQSQQEQARPSLPPNAKAGWPGLVPQLDVPPEVLEHVYKNPTSLLLTTSRLENRLNRRRRRATTQASLSSSTARVAASLIQTATAACAHRIGATPAQTVRRLYHHLHSHFQAKKAQHSADLARATLLRSVPYWEHLSQSDREELQEAEPSVLLQRQARPLLDVRNWMCQSATRAASKTPLWTSIVTSVCGDMTQYPSTVSPISSARAAMELRRFAEHLAATAPSLLQTQANQAGAPGKTAAEEAVIAHSAAYDALPKPSPQPDKKESDNTGKSQSGGTASNVQEKVTELLQSKMPVAAVRYFSPLFAQVAPASIASATVNSLGQWIVGRLHAKLHVAIKGPLHQRLAHSLSARVVNRVVTDTHKALGHDLVPALSRLLPEILGPVVTDLTNYHPERDYFCKICEATKGEGDLYCTYCKDPAKGMATSTQLQQAEYYSQYYGSYASAWAGSKEHVEEA
jgi:hypothetical protein